jgi:hypothetical protein
MSGLVLNMSADSINSTWIKKGNIGLRFHAKLFTMSIANMIANCRHSFRSRVDVAPMLLAPTMSDTTKAYVFLFFPGRIVRGGRRHVLNHPHQRATEDVFQSPIGNACKECRGMGVKWISEKHNMG